MFVVFVVVTTAAVVLLVVGGGIAVVAVVFVIDILRAVWSCLICFNNSSLFIQQLGVTVIFNGDPQPFLRNRTNDQ